MKIGDYLHDLGLAAHSLDPLQLRPQGGEGSRISLFLIGASRPVIPDFLLDRRALGSRFGCHLEYRLVQEAFIPQLKLAKGVPEHLVGRHGIVRDPAVASVLIEISARIDRWVNLFRIEVIELHRLAGVLRRSVLSESQVGKSQAAKCENQRYRRSHINSPRSS